MLQISDLNLIVLFGSFLVLHAEISVRMKPIWAGRFIFTWFKWLIDDVPYR